MAEKIEGLAKSARGKKAEAVREKLFRDAQKARDGSELECIDKYIPVIYDRLPSVFDYFSGLTVFSEYTNAVERAKGVIRSITRIAGFFWRRDRFAEVLRGIILTSVK